MRKTEYIGTEFSRFGGDRLKAATKKKTEQEVFYGDRESQIAAIDKTFSDVGFTRAFVLTNLSGRFRRGYRPRSTTASLEFYAMEETPVLPDVEASFHHGG